MATAAARVAAGLHWKHFTESSLERDARRWMLDVVIHGASMADSRESHAAADAADNDALWPEDTSFADALGNGVLLCRLGVRRVARHAQPEVQRLHGQPRAAHHRGGTAVSRVRGLR